MRTPFDIVKTVRISEKGSLLSEKYNQYTLKVDPKANKFQIRNAVEKLFNVKVTAVHTMNFTGKPMKGFVFINSQGTSTKQALDYWVDLALDFNI